MKSGTGILKDGRRIKIQTEKKIQVQKNQLDVSEIKIQTEKKIQVQKNQLKVSETYLRMTYP